MPGLTQVPQRGKRYGAQKPTHCVKGCGTVLSENYRRARRYTCKACDGIRRGHQPLYRGPCLADGCERRGAGRSGYCEIDYRVRWSKRHRRDRLLRTILGEALPLDWLREHLDDSRARDYLRRLILAIEEGRLSLSNGAALIRAGRQRWEKVPT